MGLLVCRYACIYIHVLYRIFVCVYIYRNHKFRVFLIEYNPKKMIDSQECVVCVCVCVCVFLYSFAPFFFCDISNVESVVVVVVVVVFWPLLLLFFVRCLREKRIFATTKKIDTFKTNNVKRERT